MSGRKQQSARDVTAWIWTRGLSTPEGKREHTTPYACRDGEMLVVTKNRALPFSMAPKKYRIREIQQLEGQRYFTMSRSVVIVLQ